MCTSYLHLSLCIFFNSQGSPPTVTSLAQSDDQSVVFSLMKLMLERIFTMVVIRRGLLCVTSGQKQKEKCNMQEGEREHTARNVYGSNLYYFGYVLNLSAPLSEIWLHKIMSGTKVKQKREGKQNKLWFRRQSLNDAVLLCTADDWSLYLCSHCYC